MGINKIYFTIRCLFIKTFSWEYWPIWVVYFPVSFYFLYLAIKARSCFFFSASNPTLEVGGMFFESKWKIFQLVPKKYYPNTILVDDSDDMGSVNNRMSLAGIVFPIIAKPDRGERGWGVKKIDNLQELAKYKTAFNLSFLIQSYINYPIELSVFYYRHPSQKNGIVTSVTLKKLLTVTGNGQSTIAELIEQNNRCFLQYQNMIQQNTIDFTYVPQPKEEVLLVPYGNHILGATFINYNHIIDSALTQTINTISQQINGFYFGRYDLRCASINDLKNGKNFSILEVNGAGAEPAHIYHPGFSFFKAQLTIAKHFNMMYKAAIENNKNGTAYMTYKDFRNTQRLQKTYRSKVTLV